jgi:hypothetical protein
MSKKSALLIGIDKYPYLADFAQLKGCLNDIRALRAILEQKFNFPPEDIYSLCDEQASRDGILAAMKKILVECGENDSIVFSFSGHGSRLRARRKNKPSGWYETIMPFDSGRKKYHPEAVNRDITDDEIYEWLMALSEKTSNIVLIFDSCYAGSIIRDSDFFEAGRRGMLPDDTIIHDAPAPVFSDSHSFAEGDSDKETGPSGWLPVSDKYVLFAACAEFEQAHIFKEQNGDEIIEYGALTYFLCQALREAKNGDTYHDIWEQVYLNVKTRFGKQNVQLEGKRDRELFGLAEFPPRPFLSISSRENNRLKLSGGLLHGVARDSQWEIYPPGTKYIEPPVKALGKIKVTSVQSAAAGAVLVEEDVPESVRAGNRAFEVFRPRGKSRLRVWVENARSGFEPQFNQLIQNIRKSPLLLLTNEKEAADAEIYLLGAFPEQNGNSLKFQLGNISAHAWAVAGRDGCLLSPPRRFDKPQNVEIIVENLERLSRYRRLLELRNPENAMSKQIDFIILRQNHDLSWSEIVSTGIDGELIIHESDRIALKIVNRFESPIFFSILGLGLSKKISLLYPPRGASVMVGAFDPRQSPPVNAGSQIEGKGVFTIGTKKNECFKLSFPPDFPFAAPFRENNNAKPFEGLEVFKLVVTTRPHDLSFLEQEGMRDGAPAEDEPFENLIINTLRGDEEFNKESLFKRKNEWLTIEKFFLLKRDEK